MTHIVAASLWIVGCYYHVLLLPAPEWLGYIYAAIAVWAFDRVIRNVRLAWLNFPRLRSRADQKRLIFQAEAQLYNAGEVVRLRVTPARGWPKTIGGPGTYVYVSAPWSWRMWGNHPLTIAWPADMPPVPAKSASDQDSLSHPKDRTTFELLAKRYDGFTKQLLKSIERAGGDSEKGLAHWGKLELAIEGPCASHPPPVHIFY